MFGFIDILTFSKKINNQDVHVLVDALRINHTIKVNMELLSHDSMANQEVDILEGRDSHSTKRMSLETKFDLLNLRVKILTQPSMRA